MEDDTKYQFCEHVRFNLDVERRDISICNEECEISECNLSRSSNNGSQKMMICFHCDKIFCSDHYFDHEYLSSKSTFEKKLKLSNETGKCENCDKETERTCRVCLVHFFCSDECQYKKWEDHSGDCDALVNLRTKFEKVKENRKNSSHEHRIFLDISTMLIKCRDCCVFPEDFVHPLDNIHGLSYRYVREYNEVFKKYPSEIVFTPKDFLKILSSSSKPSKKTKGKKKKRKKIKKSSFADIFSDEEFQFLTKTLFELIQLGGISGKEKVVCHYIKNLIRSMTTKEEQEGEEEQEISQKNEKEKIDFRNSFDTFQNLKVYTSPSYGLCVIDSTTNSATSDQNKSSKKPITILLDAHIDQVAQTVTPPFILKDQVSTICGTGFDNRISVAVLLTLIKFFSLSNKSSRLQLIYLFSTKEEVGYNGFRNFFRMNESRKKKKTRKVRHPKIKFSPTFENDEDYDDEEEFELDELICYDVTYGKMRDGRCHHSLKLRSGGYSRFMNFWFSNDITRLPRIGDGIVVNLQSSILLNEKSVRHFFSKNKNSDYEIQSNSLKKEIEMNVFHQEILNPSFFRLDDYITIQDSGIRPPQKELRYTNLEVTRKKKFKEKYHTKIIESSSSEEEGEEDKEVIKKKNTRIEKRFDIGMLSAVVVDMHRSISFSSLKDIWDVYRYSKLRFLHLLELAK